MAGKNPAPRIVAATKKDLLEETSNERLESILNSTYHQSMGEKYNLTIVSFYGGHATYDFREKTLQEIKTLLSPFMIVVGERGNRKKKEAIEDFFSYFRMEIFLRNSSGYAV